MYFTYHFNWKHLVQREHCFSNSWGSRAGKTEANIPRKQMTFGKWPWQWLAIVACQGLSDWLCICYKWLCDRRVAGPHLVKLSVNSAQCCCTCSRSIVFGVLDGIQIFCYNRTYVEFHWIKCVNVIFHNINAKIGNKFLNI